MRNIFGDYHPAVNFLWAAMVLLGTVVLHHPACVAIALCCAALWSVRLQGRRSFFPMLRGLLPLLLLTAALNPLFSHAGVTILCYMPDGNPLTLESTLYGVCAGVVLVTVILWFSGLTVLLTQDKFTILLGKTAPALSLLLSMAMGLVPRFRRRLEQIAQGQRAIGRDPAQGNFVERGRKGLRMLSILVTWSMESAILTADSMKSRGYGLPGRTAYDPRPLTGRDTEALGALAVLGVLLTGLWVQGALDWQYYPLITGRGLSLKTATALADYLAICAFPMLLDCVESRRWRCERGGEPQ